MSRKDYLWRKELKELEIRKWKIIDRIVEKSPRIICILGAVILLILAIWRIF